QRHGWFTPRGGRLAGDRALLASRQLTGDELEHLGADRVGGVRAGRDGDGARAPAEDRHRHQCHTHASSHGPTVTRAVVPSGPAPAAGPAPYAPPERHRPRTPCRRGAGPGRPAGEAPAPYALPASSRPPV